MFSLESKVLIVDDMMTMRRIVKKALTTIGFTQVTDAKDGQQAWELLQEGDFDIVVSDWNMPKMTGLDLLKKVRADEKYSKIPFVLLTAEADESQTAEAKEAGVDNYIIKPFSADILKERLAETYDVVKDRIATQEAA